MKVNNCASCGAKLEFSPKDKALKCSRCSSIVPIQTEQPKEKKELGSTQSSNEDGFKQWQEKRTFSCSSCGAQVVLNKLDMTSRCAYCNTPALVETKNLPGLEPDAIVPFKIDKKEASDQFVVRTKKKFFLPNDFKKRIPNTSIGSTYISAMSFSMNASGSYHGVKTRTKTVGYGKNSRTVTEHVHFSGVINDFFDDVVVECSEKINQNQINGILPYNFQESYKYNNDFTSGYSVEYYNESLENSKQMAEKQVYNKIDKRIRMSEFGVVSLTINLTYTNHKYNYILLPLYFINFKYKDKEYLNLMNGQTGKTAGKLPRSAIKITMTVLLIMFMVFGIPLIITLLSM